MSDIVRLGIRGLVCVVVLGATALVYEAFGSEDAAGWATPVEVDLHEVESTHGWVTDELQLGPLREGTRRLRILGPNALAVSHGEVRRAVSGSDVLILAERHDVAAIVASLPVLLDLAGFDRAADDGALPCLALEHVLREQDLAETPAQGELRASLCRWHEGFKAALADPRVARMAIRGLRPLKEGAEFPRYRLAPELVRVAQARRQVRGASGGARPLVLAVVGYAHLTSPDDCIAKLRRQGLRVTVVAPVVTAWEEALSHMGESSVPRQWLRVGDGVYRPPWVQVVRVRNLPAFPELQPSLLAGGSEEAEAVQAVLGGDKTAWRRMLLRSQDEKRVDVLAHVLSSHARPGGSGLERLRAIKALRDLAPVSAAAQVTLGEIALTEDTRFGTRAASSLRRAEPCIGPEVLQRLRTTLSAAPDGSEGRCILALILARQFVTDSAVLRHLANGLDASRAVYMRRSAGRALANFGELLTGLESALAPFSEDHDEVVRSAVRLALKRCSMSEKKSESVRPKAPR